MNYMIDGDNGSSHQSPYHDSRNCPVCSAPDLEKCENCGEMTEGHVMNVDGVLCCYECRIDGDFIAEHGLRTLRHEQSPQVIVTVIQRKS